MDAFFITSQTTRGKIRSATNELGVIMRVSLLVLLLICGCGDHCNPDRLLSELENVKLSHNEFVGHLKEGRAIAYLNTELAQNNIKTKVLIQLDSVISTNEPAYGVDKDNPFNESEKNDVNGAPTISRLGDYFFTFIEALNLYTEITGSKWVIHKGDLLVVLTEP